MSKRHAQARTYAGDETRDAHDSLQLGLNGWIYDRRFLRLVKIMTILHPSAGGGAAYAVAGYVFALHSGTHKDGTDRPCSSLLSSLFAHLYFFFRVGCYHCRCTFVDPNRDVSSECVTGTFVGKMGSFRCYELLYLGCRMSIVGHGHQMQKRKAKQQPSKIKMVHNKRTGQDRTSEPAVDEPRPEPRAKMNTNVVDGNEAFVEAPQPRVWIAVSSKMLYHVLNVYNLDQASLLYSPSLCLALVLPNLLPNLQLLPPEEPACLMATSLHSAQITAQVEFRSSRTGLSECLFFLSAPFCLFSLLSVAFLSFWSLISFCLFSFCPFLFFLSCFLFFFCSLYFWLPSCLSLPCRLYFVYLYVLLAVSSCLITTIDPTMRIGYCFFLSQGETRRIVQDKVSAPAVASVSLILQLSSSI